MTASEPESLVAPTCYRHPDRPTWIRCAHCDRSICPECMTPAAVGFQCPECIAEGKAATREAKTVFGGRLTSSSTVTMVLIGLCVGIFLVQVLIGVNQVASQWGMWPAGIAIGDEWFRLGSAIFLHGSILHLAFNMYVLFILGPPLERVLGHSRFLALFLISGLGGSVTSFYLSGVNSVSVGASGAIFGLMGALVVAGRHLRSDITQVLVLIGINVAIGFLVPGIDWRAHLGGLVTGAAVAMVFSKVRPGPQQTLWHIVGCTAIVAALLGVAVIRTQQIQQVLVG